MKLELLFLENNRYLKKSFATFNWLKEILKMKANQSKEVYVLGTGYSGLTIATAAELARRGYVVRILAHSLDYMPRLTVVGTQSRRWPGPAMGNQLHSFDDLLGS